MSDLPDWCTGEDFCPVTATANLLGKKYHPVILHRLLKEEKGFNELKRSIPGVTAKVLSRSLKDLQENRLVNREVLSESPKKVEYSLTEEGRSMEKVLDAMREWGEQNFTEKQG
ncbi:winged helix-turn-helix transcriptional regulator [Candidatus Nanohalococcus occultus]|uniref:DNA-binding transcriptional regulator, HxlR family n=1 Tax=Candidatus Nanohalococcus occultus TaxID=2978047 RepID=A0ABY8CEY4_9ARCH|nr:DNA-binding transcriptional regulator, HxlR family [Candidatus Nanohaloarchaeota archaeon SVXNc]